MANSSGSRLEAHSRLSSARMSRSRLYLGGSVSTGDRFRFTGCAQNALQWSCRSTILQRTANSVLFGCLSPGVPSKEFPTESAAQAAVDAIRLTINRQTPQQLLKNVSVDTLVKHYREHEVSRISWKWRKRSSARIGRTYLLDHFGETFLETAERKVQFFRDRLSIAPEAMPKVVYHSSTDDNAQVQYFVDRFPVAVHPGANGQIPMARLAYVDPGRRLVSSFARWLDERAALLHALKTSPSTSFIWRLTQG